MRPEIVDLTHVSFIETMLRIHNTLADLGKISQVKLIKEFLGRGRISSVSLNLIEQEDGSFNQLFLGLIESRVLESVEMPR